MFNYSTLFDIARDVYAMPSYNSKYGRALMPLRYFFELTYRCNLNCPYCYVGNDRNKEELTTSEWINIINQIPFYSLVTLVGGEPLLRKDFPEIYVQVSKKTLSKVNIVSNGTLLNEDLVKLFIKNNLLLFSVSIDGYEKNHDLNRGKDGLFVKVISNMELFKKHKKRPMIDVKTIILENNLDDLPKLYKLCLDNKFEFFSLSFLRNNNLKQNSVLFDSFVPQFNENYPIQKYFDMEHFKEVYNELESLSKNENTKIRFSPKFEYSKEPLKSIEKFFNISADTPVKDIYKPCKFPFSNTFITPIGDVYPCLSERIGNLKENTIKEIFNKPNYCCFRKNLKVSGVFGACQMCCELEPKI